MISRRLLTVAATLAGLSACVPRAAPDPAPRPLPPPPIASAPPVAQSLDWQDWPVASGNWSYAREGNATIARFGPAGGAPDAWVRCDLGTRAIMVGRAGQAGSPDGATMMMLRTSFGLLQWPARGTAAATEASRAANDPGLDQIAFSRGRFTIELPGMAPLVLPTWAEPVRVIEDCRG